MESWYRYGECGDMSEACSRYTRNKGQTRLGGGLSGDVSKAVAAVACCRRREQGGGMLPAT